MYNEIILEEFLELHLGKLNKLQMWRLFWEMDFISLSRVVKY
jgi:hypothetical protein